MCTYPSTLNRGGPWDTAKARSNVAKHGVRFADAALMFDDPVVLTVVDDESDPIEQRFVVLGAAAGRVLLRRPERAPPL